MDNKSFLGKNSYPAIVEEIYNKIQEAKADTLSGSELLNETYAKLNESKTPMMDVKEFITKAEQVSNDDASLKEVVDFCKKSATKGDLNYIINLCKEEHFKNLSRTGHPNPEKTIEEIKEMFGEPASIIEQGIRNGLFDRLNSRLLNNVKIGLDIKPEDNTKDLDDSKNLDESYDIIYDDIVEKVRTTKADTITGMGMLNNLYTKLNESLTPILDVKDFVNEADQLKLDDKGFNDVVEYCRKKAAKGDLNYIINVCKEEHFRNLQKAGHQAPTTTVKDIDKLFKKPASIVEEHIKNGKYDKLQSQLLDNLKIRLGLKKSSDKNDLNESYQYDLGGYCQYTPIGITMEDKKNNSLVILTESDILSFDKAKQEFIKLDNFDVNNISTGHKRLMESLTKTSYNPETETFTLNENWDFDLALNGNGICTVNGKEIGKEHLVKLLLESVNHYTMHPDKVENFNREAYLADADNIICLMENANALMKLDKLRVIRNLNEDTYCMFDMHDVTTTNTPKVLSIKGESKLFESFMDLNKTVSEYLNYDCKKLFENQIMSEQQQLLDRQNNIDSLTAQQKELNEAISKVRNLKSLAEIDSPAMEKLVEQEIKLNESLKENIENLNFYTNEFKLH